jgi:hypothetical protein
MSPVMDQVRFRPKRASLSVLLQKVIRLEPSGFLSVSKLILPELLSLQTTPSAGLLGQSHHFVRINAELAPREEHSSKTENGEHRPSQA